MTYTYIHLMLQEQRANDVLRLAVLCQIMFQPAVRTPGSCYNYLRGGISHVQHTDAETKVKSFITGLIEISPEISYRIEKM